MGKTTFTPEQVTALPSAAAAAFAWQARGQLQVTVVVKATFAFAPDAEMKLSEPQEVLLTEVYHRGQEGRVVRFANDRAPYLARADVVFTGHAHAKPGAAVASMPVRIQIHDGDRALLDKTIVAQDTAPFERMPIIYDRAIAGPDMQENPFGVPQEGPEAPNVVDPADPSRPAGFGPIARAWPSRKRLLGDTPREALERPIQEIPDHFDWSYFQSAPRDQQIDHLRGGEWIALYGLHPELPELRTRLPEARGVARVYGLSAFGVAEGQPLDLLADSLRIDGDEQRCTLSFRRSFPVPSEAALASARIVAGVELRGVPLAWPPPPASLRPDVTLMTIDLPGDGASAHPTRAATPFHSGPAPEAIAKSAGPPPPKLDTGTLALGPEATFKLAPALPYTNINTNTNSSLERTLAMPPEEEEIARGRPPLPFEPAPLGAAPELLVRPPGPIEVKEHLSTGTLALSPQEDDVRAPEPSATPSPPPPPEPPSAAAPPASVKEPAASAVEPPEPPAAPLPLKKQRPAGRRPLPAPPRALKEGLYKRFERK